MCKYYLRVQTFYPIAKHSNKDYSELMAYVRNAKTSAVTHKTDLNYGPFKQQYVQNLDAVFMEG